MAALFLSPILSTGNKFVLPKRSSKLMVDMRVVLQIHQDEATINKHFRCQILWLILPFWWVKPEVRRSFVGTSSSRSGNNLLCFISKYLPGEMITFVISKSNPMSSFLIGLARESVVRFIFTYLVVNRFPERKV